MTNFPSSITHIAGIWGNGGASKWNISTNPAQNLTDNSTKHYDLYDVPSNSTYANNGIQFVLNGNATEVHVEGTGDLGAPTSVAIGNTYNSQSTVTITDGDTVSFWASPTQRYFSMVVTQSMLFSSGPTVTSITVANEIASTRQFTVTHSGTLTANDISYKINGVDITSLSSPNTPITNLQTTATGSTFDSYTLSSNGYHLINIGSQYLEFYKSSTTLAQTSFPELNNAGLTITFPSTSALWLAKAPGYDSVTLYNDGTQYKATIQKFGADHIEYLWVGTKYFTNADPSLRGFKWYQIIYSDTTKQWYTSDVFYIDPVAIYESTGLTTTSFLSPSQDFMTSYSFDFVSLIAQAPTNTSNGGGKRRRYPIISTNLFDRQRSIYSIGLTHKDETLF